MKSARRKAYIERKNKSVNKKNNFSLIKILIPALLLIGVYFFVKINTRIWNGEDKVSIVYKEENGNVAVTVVDPTLSEITTLVIPGDTQVDVARNYGSFLIKNVWQLGMDEKIGGDLLAETVTQNFLFPVFQWHNDNPGLDSGNLPDILNFVFFPGQTNISFGDRLHIGLFAIKVKNLGRSVIDLGESKFLDKKVLEDGQPGYVIAGTISQRLTIYFSDNEIEKNNVKVNITDATGTVGISEKLGEILQVIGGKIVSIDKKSAAEDMDCIVVGKNSKAVRKIANLFDCKIENSETSFDLDIKVGEKFAERF